MNGSLVFHHEDHLSGGSVDTDSLGAIISLIDYYPFGDTRIEENSGDYENDYKFTGKEKDEDTGLYYYEARYYDSGIGRFVGVDPWSGDLSDPQTLNKYSYVTNNPLKYVDPSGEKVELVIRQIDYESMPQNTFIQRIDRTLASMANHSFLRIYPDSPDDFGGEHKVTLGAGRDVGDILKKGYNHPNDVYPKSKIRSITTIPTPEGKTDTEHIQDILKIFNDYGNNIQYDPLSRGNKKNCNDFTTELITKSGGSVNSIDPKGFDVGLGDGGLKDGNKNDKVKQEDNSSERSKKEKNKNKK